MIIGHAEIDGVVARVLPDDALGLKAQLSRTVKYTEIAPEAATKVAAHKQHGSRGKDQAAGAARPVLSFSGKRRPFFSFEDLILVT